MSTVSLSKGCTMVRVLSGGVTGDARSAAARGWRPPIGAGMDGSAGGASGEEQGFRPASGSELGRAERVTSPAEFGVGVGCYLEVL